MNKGAFLGLALASGLFLLIPGQAQAENSKMIDATNTPAGWQVYSEKPPGATLDINNGPTVHAKALQLNYQFSDGLWIAIVKDIHLSLGADDAIRFYYKGTGATVNLKVKLKDSGGTVFGCTVPFGTEVEEWKEVVLPRSYFAYLWGGQGAGSMHWNSLAKFEWTLDLDQTPGASYTIEKSKPGKIWFSNLEVISARGVKVDAAIKPAAPAPALYVPKFIVGHGGYVLIHPNTSTEGWKTVSDKDGQCSLSAKPMLLSTKKVKVLNVDFNFGENGSWNALVLTTVDMNLSAMNHLRFIYRGEGGQHKLTVKLSDAAHVVYGCVLKTPTDAKKWTEVKLAKANLQHLYGGGPNQSIDWGKIQTIEFTFDRQDTTNNSGVIYFGPLLYK